MPFCIGLTGGVGSGKTSAARIFQELGAAVVDTDEIAHDLTRPGGAAVAAIRSEFGADYVAADGGLDRAKMRRLVFADAVARKKLEAILHPLIRKDSQARIAAAQQPYVLVVVPLLLETGAYRELIGRVLVIDCDEERQIARAMKRSALSSDEVRAIMAAQLPRAKRLAAADDVLHNDADLQALRRQAEALHEKYVALARKASQDASP
ncbi:MAG: dephospho-CoA kinase [Betaproteobacteria bacterium RIFCSPLOWO2_12_FULL_62_58]|nr:MAG: dephospho-CoA kinase [Betaproteobacteria bacterium RIFCSPLOWO2_12_FULL_62_58]